MEPANGGTRICYQIDLGRHGWVLRLLSNFLAFGKIHSRAIVGLFDGLKRG